MNQERARPERAGAADGPIGSIVLITDSLGDMRTGGSIRQHQIATSLAPLGIVTVVSLRPPTDTEREWVEKTLGTEIVALPTAMLSMKRTVTRWFGDRSLPWRLAQRDSASVARELEFSRRHRNHLIVPNGFDNLLQTSVASDGPVSIVFPASFTHPPNLDGAEWFVETVVPEIRRMNRDLPVVLAGSGPDQLKRYGDTSTVVVTGPLESMDEVLSDGAIVASPLLGGSGTRMKILEAWARGLPVVTTPKGADGLGAVHGVNVLLASSPTDFARQCLRLADSASLRSQIGRAGKDRLGEEFSWEVLGSRLRKSIRELLAPEPTPQDPVGSSTAREDE